MNNLEIKGTQNFMGHEIPVVLGGFGEDKKCIADKTVAEIHDMEIKHIRELVNRSPNRFKESIDYINLKAVVQNDHNFLSEFGYSKMQISKSNNIYLFSERGYSKLIKTMDTDLAWEIHDKLMDEYFTMRDMIIPQLTEMLFTQEQEMRSLINLTRNEVSEVKAALNLTMAAMNTDTSFSYQECMPKGKTKESIPDKSKYVNYLVTQIAEYGKFDNEKLVFSQIYKLMSSKKNIDIHKYKRIYERHNPGSQVSPYTVILESDLLYKVFISVAEGMLNTLKSRESIEDYTLAIDFADAKEHVKDIAARKFSSNIGLAYKYIYNKMKDYGVKWDNYNVPEYEESVSKPELLQRYPELQGVFIKVVIELLHEIYI